MTVKELWDVTTCELYLLKRSAEGAQQRVKLPDGGRLQIEHAELRVKKIELVKRSMEPPCMVVETEEETE